MNAVIVDLDGQRAAALCEDGSVREVENLDYIPGQTIVISDNPGEDENTETERPDNSRRNRRRSVRITKWYRKAAAAAAIVLMLTGIGGVSVYAMPYGEVSLDAGTSVTYTINRFDYVLSAKAEDEEGAQIINEIGEKNLVNRKVEKAVAVTLDHINEENESAPDMDIHVRTDISSSESSADQAHAKKLQGKLEKVLTDRVSDGRDPADIAPADETPADRVPDEPVKDPEDTSVKHPDGQSEGESDPALRESDFREQNSPERSADEQIPDDISGESPADPGENDPEAKPENLPEDEMENTGDDGPADSENMQESGEDRNDLEDSQETFEENPGGRPDEHGENPGGGQHKTGPNDFGR